MSKLRNSMFTPASGAVRRVVSSRLAVAALAVAGTAAVVGGVAAAAIPDNAGVIHGCYNHADGTLRVIDAPGAMCKPGEVALPWNQAGPQGPPGPAGPTGVAVTQVIPPTDAANPTFVPVTLHLTTGTWHVTGENRGAGPQAFGGCNSPTTTGTILGEVVTTSDFEQDFLVDVGAPSGTVTLSCLGDTETGASFSENLFAVPVVMQQP